MEFDYHVNIAGICPELLVGIITAERIYYEFGESMHVSLAGKTYIQCNLPKDEITAGHMVKTIGTRLTSDFEITENEKFVLIEWSPNGEKH